MPLPMPVLDDRGFQELADGMRERLPRIAPEWTDHNASDPGITLLELFAYHGDILSYRFDRIPPRLYRAFLRLLGCEPLRERTALTPVTFGCQPRGGARSWRQECRSPMRVATCCSRRVPRFMSAMRRSPPCSRSQLIAG